MVAEETGMAFLSVSAAEIVTKWQGESGKNAKAMFDVSKKICIIYNHLSTYLRTPFLSFPSACRRAKLLITKITGLFFFLGSIHLSSKTANSFVSELFWVPKD